MGAAGARSILNLFIFNNKSRIFGLNLHLIALAYIQLIKLIETLVFVKISAKERLTTGDLKVTISARMEISVFGAMIMVILVLLLRCEAGLRGKITWHDCGDRHAIKGGGRLGTAQNF